MLVCVAAAVSPVESQSTYTELTTSFLAPYNRWGWALLAPVALRLAAPAGHLDPVGGIALGIAISGLLLLKISYGAAALGLLAVSTILRSGGWRDAVLAGPTIVGALLLAELLTGQVSANLKDIIAISALEHSGIRFGRIPRLSGEAGIYATFGLLLLLLGITRAAPDIPLRAGWALCRVAALLLAVSGIGAAILMQNHDYYGASVYPMLLLAAAEWGGLMRARALWEHTPLSAHGATSERDPASLHAEDRMVPVLVVLLVVVVMRGPLIEIGTAAAQHIWLRTKPPTTEAAIPTAEFDGTPLEMLYLTQVEYPGPGVACRSFTCYTLDVTLDGLEMLRNLDAGGLTNGTVILMSSSNPYPTILDIPPPAHVPVWLDFGRSIGTETLPPPERFFADAKFVILMRQNPLAQWPKSYADLLAREFETANSSARWTVLKRTSAPTGE